MNYRRIIGLMLMVGGPLLTVSSSWWVFSFEPIRRRVYDEGWMIFEMSGSAWISELRESDASWWLLSLAVIGIAALFCGLWLYRSTRCRRVQLQIMTKAPNEKRMGLTDHAFAKP
jgi:hypothetical protein